MNRVILILSDALRYDVAKDNMGFLGHLVEVEQASLYKIIGELPIHRGASGPQVLPDYLLLHPMGMDYFGETFGADTKEYRGHATYQDKKLVPLIIEWRDRGYTILVTGDHGINADGNHGGTISDQRDVPFFVIQPNGQGKGDTGNSHLQIAPTILKLLDVPIPETMRQKPLSFD